MVDRGWPPIGGHRLLGNGVSVGLVTLDGEIDWWCAPRVDDPPLLWSLLDRAGAAARWRDVELVAAPGRPAGPVVRTTLRSGGYRIECCDALVVVGGRTCLARLVRAETGGLTLVHELSLGGFDGPRAVMNAPVASVGALDVSVVTGGSTEADGQVLTTTHQVTETEWSGLVVALGSGPGPAFDDVVAAVDRAEGDAAALLETARLPRHHPERAADALAVLAACTYEETGAVLAAATTSLPEAPGADRQFDYRYCWLRDAALAVSVASLLGRRDTARRYLEFVRTTAFRDSSLCPPVVDVNGDDVPEERTVDGVEGWHESTPVRVGNAARRQVQYDAWGLVVEAVSVYVQTGGSLDDETWQLVSRLADRFAVEEPKLSSGIWELREPKDLVSADIGRWLVLDRAIWIARGWRPLAKRRRWIRARNATAARVLGAVRPDGRLPQGYASDSVPDASALMVVVFGMVRRQRDLAALIVDATLRDLETGPFLRRYPTDVDDGFHGREGAFLPMTWWAVSALAQTGRLDEAHSRLDEACARLPALLSEEVDPVSGQSLGNVPLVWSHMELARALYIIDAETIRRRNGAAALWVWRLARYARLRWGSHR